MLVLSRRLGERIRVGPDVWITVVRIERDRVRIGIECPDDMKIMREELIPVPCPPSPDAPPEPEGFADGITKE